MYLVTYTQSAVIGTNSFGGTHSGDNLWIDDGINKELRLPTGYNSGDPISGKLTIAGESLASTGLAIGNSFTWAWEKGEFSDSATFNVVPEPASLMLIGLSGFGLVVCRRIFRT